jgi:hypothetical protein
MFIKQLSIEVRRTEEKQLRLEIARMVDSGGVEEDQSPECASPTFAIAMKNGTMRVVANFTKLNS